MHDLTQSPISSFNYGCLMASIWKVNRPLGTAALDSASTLIEICNMNLCFGSGIASVSDFSGL